MTDGRNARSQALLSAGAAVTEVNCGAEQGLQLARPAQIRAPVNQALQGTELMRQADLMLLRGCVQLGFPTITQPDFGVLIAHEVIDDITSRT
jgi:hypothetical protein